MPGYQAHHAHSLHPPLHLAGHGHCHPIRLLLGHQAAAGRVGS